MTFVLCPECGNCLGEIIRFVELARKGFLKTIIEKKYKGYSPDKICIQNINADIGFILDLVGAKLVCCRHHLIGAIL